MNNGTERDEPGQRSEDGPQGHGPAESGRRSSDPVWPVWGGAVATTPTEPGLPVDEPADEVTTAEPVFADGAPAAERVAEAPESGELEDDAATADAQDDVPGAVAHADDASVDEAPAGEASVDEAPAGEASVDEPPAGEATVDEAPASEASVDEPPAGEETVDETPADETTADETTADETTAGQAPTDETSAVETPADVAPADGALLDEAAAGQTSVDGTSADDTLVDDGASDAAAGLPVDVPADGDPEDESPDGVASDEIATDADDAVGDVTVDEVAVEEPGVDATDSHVDATDVDATDDDATDLDATDADATDLDATDVDATDNDGTDDDATGADATDGDATAVIAPVAAGAAATAPIAAPASPVGSLTAPVTRTVPGPARPATPTSSAPVVPSAAAAATAPLSATPAAPDGGTAPAAASPSAQPGGRIASGPVPPSARKESPLDVFQPDEAKRRWPKRVLIVASVIVVLGAAYVGASYALADRVPRGATVAGVDIGGLPSGAAVDLLDDELADATTLPIDVVANDVQATIDPAAAGLTFDAEGTVAELTGVNLAQPQRLLQHIAGVGEHDPVTTVDDDALDVAIDDLGTSLTLAPVDGTVVFIDGSARSTAAVDGWGLDQAEAANVLADGWVVAERPIDLPTQTVEPDITQAETDAAVAQAQQVTSAPVAVAVAGRSAALDVPTLAANASFVPVEGALVLQMNGEGLAAAVLAQLPDLLTASADAHFEFVDGAPVIIPGTPGTSLDPVVLGTTVATASTATDRTAAVELVQADPSQSTAELEALGVKEIVGEFSTPLNSEPRRTKNIANGASKITGTLIRPEETFSLTEALGPIDAAHGYVQAGAIVSGEHTDAWGGGLSQISTTTYNAGFMAGFEDVEHRPHSEWFSRYPEGREATLFTGSLDMRWKNNTPYGALVQSWVSDGRVYVRIWGTKHWTVESITSPRSGVVQPTTVYSQTPTCEAQSAGNPGFSVTVTRKTSLNGELVKTESNAWRYKPQNKVICGAPPEATSPPAP